MAWSKAHASYRVFAWLLIASSIVACRASPNSVKPAATCTPCAHDATAAAATAETATPVDVIADQVVRLLQAGDGAGLFALYGPDMQHTFPVDTVRRFVSSILARHGAIMSSSRLPGDDSSDRRAYRIKAEKGDAMMSLAVDSAGRIQGLEVRPVTDAEPPTKRSDVPLGLPFRGEWSVAWGGDTYEVNRHLRDRDQRRAADLDRLGRDGKTYRGSGASNTDYYAYGEEILAVADGTVVTAVDGVPENVPGSQNPYIAPGNFVVVRHRDDLFSVYGHLQPGSIRVKVGGSVTRGTTLGLCGNSGNSSEPHLHFQLQDGPLIETSWGVTPFFANVSLVRDGKTTSPSEYTFLKGDRIREDWEP
jgi:murein DD-endopeptidase MepM/ murein hydrolase activator NlpD